MSLLQDKLPPNGPRCFEIKEGSALIEFETAHMRATFPVSQLARAVWRKFAPDTPPQDGASEHWRLAFATADVVITGWRLHKLAGYLREHKLAVVREINGYPGFPEQEPFVSKISLFENDEPGNDEPEPVEGDMPPLPPNPAKSYKPKIR